MEDISIEQIIINKCLITIYCDNCGKKLGSSYQERDGYYERFGELNLSFDLNEYGRYELNKNLCDDCRIKYMNKLIETLSNIGFVPEE